MPPSRAQGCVQADYQQVIPNLQFTYCIMHKLHEWSKKCFGKGFGWICALNSARACTYHFLPYNSSGIDLFGMRTVQADSCFNSEQIGTLLLVWGVRKGALEGGWSIWAKGPKFTRNCQECPFYASCLTCVLACVLTCVHPLLRFNVCIPSVSHVCILYWGLTCVSSVLRVCNLCWGCTLTWA